MISEICLRHVTTVKMSLALTDLTYFSFCLTLNKFGISPIHFPVYQEFASKPSFSLV